MNLIRAMLMLTLTKNDIDPPVVDIVAGEVNNDVTLTAPTALMVLACL